MKTIWIFENDRSSTFVYEQILAQDYAIRIFDSVPSIREELGNNHQAPDILIAGLKNRGDEFGSYLESSEFQPELAAKVPFFVVSPLDCVEISRLCLSRGALDYVITPFCRSELLFKIERFATGCPSPSTSPLFDLDPITLTARRGSGQSLTLTSKEFQIASVLQRSLGYEATREKILRDIWKTVKVSAKTFDVHLFNLRRKFQPLGLIIEHVPPRSYRILSRPLPQEDVPQTLLAK